MSHESPPFGLQGATLFLCAHMACVCVCRERERKREKRERKDFLVSLLRRTLMLLGQGPILMTLVNLKIISLFQIQSHRMLGLQRMSRRGARVHLRHNNMLL